MSEQQRQKFGFLTFWAKGKLQQMLGEFDPQEGIALSGSFSLKKDNIAAFAAYLEALPDRNGYVQIDASVFFADPDKSFDFNGALQEPYKKAEGGSTGTRQLRSL